MTVGTPNSGQVNTLGTLNLRGERSVTCKGERDRHPSSGPLPAGAPVMCEEFRKQPDALERAAALDMQYGTKPDLDAAVENMRTTTAERIMLRELLRRVEMKVIQENELDVVVRLHTSLPPGKIGLAPQSGPEGNTRSEMTMGPNAGETEVLIPAGYVREVYDPVFVLSPDRKRDVARWAVARLVDDHRLRLRRAATVRVAAFERYTR